MPSRHPKTPVSSASANVSPQGESHAQPAVQVRPVIAEDLPRLDSLLNGLDDRSRYLRWFYGAIDIGAAVSWAAHPERNHASGFVAIASNGELVGHAALIPMDESRAEVCFEVAAPWRHLGVAGLLLVHLERRAGELGIESLVAMVLPENADMLAVLREHGPCREHRVDGTTELELPVDPGRELRAS